MSLCVCVCVGEWFLQCCALHLGETNKNTQSATVRGTNLRAHTHRISTKSNCFPLLPQKFNSCFISVISPIKTVKILRLTKKKNTQTQPGETDKKNKTKLDAAAPLLRW